MATDTDREKLTNGLRILARMIASVHLREMNGREEVLDQAAEEPVISHEKVAPGHSRTACTCRAKKAGKGRRMLVETSGLRRGVEEP